MAAKIDSSTSQQLKLEHLKWMLQEVDCPFIEENDDSWTLSLFEPCEARMRLISWLITKFEASFGNILSKQVPTVNNRIDSRVQRMLFLCNMMGLCRSDDLDIIKGTASKRKQMKFWENLLEHVLMSDKFDRQEKSSLGYVSDSQSSRQLFSTGSKLEESCRFIDTLVRQEEPTALFSPSLTLFPPDLEKIIKADASSKNYKSKAPENSFLQELVDKLSSDVEKSEKEYSHLIKKFDHELMNQKELDGYCKRLSLAITMLSQLVGNFLHCYDSELRHWCNRPKAKKSGIGPASKTTLQMMTRFKELLEQIRVLENAYNTLRNDISRGLLSTELETDIGHDALMNLRQTIDILRESDTRINESL